MMTTTMVRLGFTLLELMVTLLIIGILAAIAIPSYSRYVRTSASADAQSQMLRIAGDLERWRAKNLSYTGFTPEAGLSFASTGSITSVPGATIYLPIGSGLTNYRYQLALLDGSRATALTSTVITGGQSWIMIAQPNTSNSILSLASRLVLNSQGLRCKTDSAVTDASMKLNITTTTISDAALCTSPSLPW
jgi:type IV pilus assembly protein PilE